MFHLKHPGTLTTPQKNLAEGPGGVTPMLPQVSSEEFDPLMNFHLVSCKSVVITLASNQKAALKVLEHQKTWGAP